MEEKSSKSKLFIQLIVAVVVIWALSGVLTIVFLDNWQDRGTFGDLFGAANSLFSALALAALIYTIVLQREGIQQNRGEIQANKKELEKSAKIQRKAQIVLQEQVVQTHLSAKMNAMQTLINYYNSQVSDSSNSPEVIERARQKRKEIIVQIDDLIDGLEDSVVE